MTMFRPRFRGVLLVPVVLAAVSCEPSVPEGSTEFPASALKERVREALDDVRRARSALPSDREEVDRRLSAAELELRSLDEFYLPLLAARYRVSAALASLGEGDGSPTPAVDSAESLLMGIVRGHGRHLEREMRGPLERLADVRAALSAGDTAEARRVLTELRDHLASAFFRGGLVLEGSELDPDAPGGGE